MTEPAQAAIGHSVALLRPAARSLAKQLQDLGDVNVEGLPTDDFTDWPKVRLHGRNYILEDWLHRKRPRTSWIGDHGRFLSEVIGGRDVGRFWCCGYCGQIFAAKATSSPGVHLNQHHQKYEEGKEATTPVVKKQRPAFEIIRGAARSTSSTPLSAPSPEDSFKTSLLDWEEAVQSIPNTANTILSNNNNNNDNNDNNGKLLEDTRKRLDETRQELAETRQELADTQQQLAQLYVENQRLKAENRRLQGKVQGHR
ncbi:uncharacterized protein B0T15DRAFT_530765 [Chaetomium strumarium]|uniref:Uncharacterized protein n=1 Tax=Chaetomium strumarium TaxID=1170767 RepID=A0AAJ0M3G0_9PEZI|nr:hypothetical protein B0T15DRAFT_530765 [Chaetomium strumarium]